MNSQSDLFDIPVVEQDHNCKRSFNEMQMEMESFECENAFVLAEPTFLSFLEPPCKQARIQSQPQPQPQPQPPTAVSSSSASVTSSPPSFTDTSPSPLSPEVLTQLNPPTQPLSARDYQMLLLEARDTIVSMSHTVHRLSLRLQELEGQGNEPSFVVNSPPPPKRSQVELEVCSPVESVWYAERAFPSFQVRIVDRHTHQTRTDLSGVKVSLSVIDGFGSSANDKIATSPHCKDLVFTTANGVATIHMFRFKSVSSKCGGHFKFILSVNERSSDLPSSLSVVTSPVQVLSYRLYHAPKLNPKKLLPSDSIQKIRGIGTMYAKRLSLLGVTTVKELALLEVSKLNHVESGHLMDMLRKERGALTMSRLNEHINLAREAMLHHENVAKSSTSKQ